MKDGRLQGVACMAIKAPRRSIEVNTHRSFVAEGAEQLDIANLQTFENKAVLR
jgi:hypothetical protein